MSYGENGDDFGSLLTVFNGVFTEKLKHFRNLNFFSCLLFENHTKAAKSPKIQKQTVSRKSLQEFNSLK
jgi:hypothetical protein